MNKDIEFNKKISKNIKELMDFKQVNFYELSKKTNKKRSTYSDKLRRLSNGSGISTTSLYEIAVLLEVPVYFLIK